jgi:hypothetical protein
MIWDYRGSYDGFSANDIVIVVRREMYPDLNGMVGRVVVLNAASQSAGVDFSRNITPNYAFHTLNGKIKNNTGWWLPIEDLELLSGGDSFECPDLETLFA